MSGRTILDSLLHKLPSSRKYYRVTLFVPDNGIPIIEYHQANSSKKPKKTIQFVDLLFADKKHDINEKFAFSIYTTEETVTFLAKEETTMNEWLTRIRECHSNLYPEFKRYDAVFEANLLDKGLAKTMNIQGAYRLALCKESLDLIPLLSVPHLLQKHQHQPQSTTSTPTTNKSESNHHQTSNETILTNMAHHIHHPIINPLNTNTIITPHFKHIHVPQHLPSYQRFHKRHPLLSSKTIELVLRSIRRCGHTDCNFYIESGRHSQIGEGDLWMTLTKKSTARHLHELLLATMKLASGPDDQFLYKTPRSRSGSSSENAHRSHQSRSSSHTCLATSPHTPVSTIGNSSNSNKNDCNNCLTSQIQASMASSTASTINTIPMLSTNNNIDEDNGYLPMA